MRPGMWIVVALIIAAGIAARGGLYELVSAGPDSAYLVHRWTGEVRAITGTTWRPVKAATLPDLEREFRK